MTDILNSEMEAMLAQKLGGTMPLGVGNLISSQGFSAFESGAGFGGFENASGFGTGGDASYSASYESYSTGGPAVSDLGASAIGGIQTMETYSSEGVGLAGGALEAAPFSVSAAEEYSASTGGLAALESGVALTGESSSMEFSSTGASVAALLPLNAYKIQVDANPTVIRRQMSGAAIVQKQNIIVRFLRPPAPPAPGPLIIKEIRPPQPRPAPPLVIKQRPPRPRTPPPLILREKPPKMPVVAKTKTVIKKLAALAPPPRQVIVERYPALPAKPRDVIIERWMQYGPLPKRKVIYQKAAAAKAYRAQKNLIIQYVAQRPALQRVFRRLGVVAMNPLSYVSQYGATLLDAGSLVSAARSAGVVESIAPPALVYPLGSSTIGGADGIVSSSAASFYSSSEDQGLVGGFGGMDSSALALMEGSEALSSAEFGAADLSSSGFNSYSMVGGVEGIATEAAEFEGGMGAGGFEYSSASETVETGTGGISESYESSTYTSSAVNEA